MNETRIAARSQKQAVRVRFPTDGRVVLGRLLLHTREWEHQSPRNDLKNKLRTPVDAEKSSPVGVRVGCCIRPWLLREIRDPGGSEKL